MRNTTQIYKAILKENGLTQKVLAERLGYANQSCIAAKLSGGAKLDSLYELAEHLGYEIVIRKKNAKKGDVEYVVRNIEE